MKPSPMPLFNYRKRERHALVSDPQKISKPDTSVDPGPANQIPTSAAPSMNRFDSDSSPSVARNNAKFSSYSSFTNNNIKNSKSQSSSTAWNTPTNKSMLSHTTKQPLSFPKLPGLMNHKVGVDNRRITSTGKDSMPLSSSFDDHSGKNYNSGPNNQSFPAKRPTLDSIARDSNRGRGKGNTSISSSSNPGATARGRGANNFLNKTPTTTTTGRKWDDNSYAQSSSTHPSVSNDFPTASMPGSSFGNSVDSWSNGSTAPNKWNNQNCNVRSKSNAVKLQSGNVQSQFGMSRPNNTNNQIKSGANPIQSNSFQSRNQMGTSQSTVSRNNTVSIFDEEDVAQPSKNQKLSFTPLDTSLRIFTCPIRDVQSWSEAGLYDGPVLFEVYGLIISGPTDIDSDLGKEFYLRDQSATIRCVFYEIDREMQRVIKGHVHRIIGSMQRKQGSGGGYLKVVSVRKADKEERKTCQKATEVSLNEMDKLVRQLDKEQ